MSVKRELFRTPTVADLYELLSAPDMMVQKRAGYTQSLARDLYQDLKKWDEGNRLCVKQLDQKRIRRLGFYAEALMEFLLREHPRFDLLTVNHQVVMDGKTVGELDFVFRDLKLGELIHLELACKYYLKLPEVTGLEGFVGLNKNDTLARKWNKMKSIQLNPKKEWLESIEGLDGQLPKSIACFKGRLFFQDEVEIHPEINPDCNYGKWVKHKNAITEGVDHCHKLSWLSGVDPERTNYPKVEYRAEMYCSQDQQRWWIVQ